jgi:hypothetical protein
MQPQWVVTPGKQQTTNSDCQSGRNKENKKETEMIDGRVRKEFEENGK